LLRAPRYAPDGQGLAFVDAGGRVGIVELPGARLTVDEFAAVGPPAWLPNSSGVLVAGTDSTDTGGVPDDALAPPGGPVLPLEPWTAAQADGSGPEVVLLRRSGFSIAGTELGMPAVAPVAGIEGSVAFLRPEGPAASAPGGRLYLADSLEDRPRLVTATRDLLVASASFGPEPDALALGVLGPGGDLDTAGIWILDVEEGDLVDLDQDGWQPRWLP
ncbi:MAG: hypothetical protein ACRDGV_00510, partial [Candidatus Limnocylindria bacterium]